MEKQRAVTYTEKVKQIAVLKASQNVEVAEQEKLEAEQKKRDAIEYKHEQIVLGKGDAEYKKLVMSAAGALAQKLEARVQVNRNYAESIGKQKWVPEIQMGSTSGGQSNAVEDLLNLLFAKTARVVNLDVSIPGEKINP